MGMLRLIWDPTDLNRVDPNLRLSHRSQYYRTRRLKILRNMGITRVAVVNSLSHITSYHCEVCRTIEDVTVRFAEPTPGGESISLLVGDFYVDHYYRGSAPVNCTPNSVWPESRLPPSSYMHANSHLWLSEFYWCRVLRVIIPRIH